MDWFNWDYESDRSLVNFGRAMGVSRQRAEQVKNSIEHDFAQNRDCDEWLEIADILANIQEVVSRSRRIWSVEDFMRFLIHQGLIEESNHVRAISDLSVLVGVGKPYRVKRMNHQDYVMPHDYEVTWVNDITSQANRSTSKFGCGILFEDFFQILRENEWFSDEHILLVTSTIGYHPDYSIVLEGKAFVANFRESDKIKTQLMKMFASYDQVYANSMVGGLIRFLRRGLNEWEKAVLERASVFFDEYAIGKGYISYSGLSSRVASESLQKEINESAICNQILDQAAKQIVDFINENNGMVTAEELNSFIQECGMNEATRNLIEPYSSLILRYGAPRKGIYTTLNHTYNPDSGVIEGRLEEDDSRIFRDGALADRVKQLHEYRCQICGQVIQLGGGRIYAEAHHIIPFGAPHNGPDIAENLICVCPNHHVMLDHFAIELNVDEIRQIRGHEISDESVRYHNRRVMIE